MARKRIDDRNLYKRGDTWYLRTEIDGKEIRKSLGTSDLELAARKRDAWFMRLDGIELEKLDGGAPKAVATVGQAVDAYVDRWHQPDDHSRSKNANDFMRILRRSKGLKEGDRAVRALSMDDFTPEAVARAQQAFLAEAPAGNKEARNDKANSFNDAWRRAKGFFAHRQAFAELNMGSHFERALAVPPLSAKRDTAFQPFTAKEGEALLAGLAALKSGRQHLYLAAGLMFYCGCRNDEAGHARRSWLKRRADGKAELTIGPDEIFKPKRGRTRRVLIPTEFADDLERLGGADFFASDGMLPTVRWSLTHRVLNSWFGEILPERDVYDLRRHAGSVVAMDKDAGGIWAAQVFLGHESIVTTQKYYAGLIRDLPVVPMGSAFR